MTSTIHGSTLVDQSKLAAIESDKLTAVMDKYRTKASSSKTPAPASTRQAVTPGTPARQAEQQETPVLTLAVQKVAQRYSDRRKSSTVSTPAGSQAVKQEQSPSTLDAAVKQVVARYSGRRKGSSRANNG